MAQEALWQLGLDQVLLVPVAVPPHKRLRDDPGAAVRLVLVRLAVAGDERFAASAIELERPGPSYTVDTLRALHAAAPEDELTFIVGADNARGFDAVWREPEEVLRLATLAVAERQGLARLDRPDPRFAAFDMPRVDVSSSDVRARVRAGRPIRFLVPDPVAGAIAEQGLYRS